MFILWKRGFETNIVDMYVILPYISIVTFDSKEIISNEYSQKSS